MLAGCKPKCPRVCDRPALSCIVSRVLLRGRGRGRWVGPMSPDNSAAALERN